MAVTKFAQPIQVGSLSSSPSGTNPGTIYYNTTSNSLQVNASGTFGALVVAGAVSSSLVPVSTSGAQVLGSQTNYWGPSFISTLADTSSVLSVDMFNRNLVDSGGNTSVAWSDRDMYDLNSILSEDWNARRLFDNTGLLSSDWKNRHLVSTTNLITVDWEGTVLNDLSDVESMDWTGRQLLDPSGNPSADWNQRLLYDNAVTTTMDWSHRILYGSDGSRSLTWDDNGAVSVGSLTNNSGSLSIVGGSGSAFATTIKCNNAASYNFNLPTTAGTSGQLLTSGGGGASNMTWTNAHLGTVTSVALTVPSFLSVSGSPVTSSGTLAVTLATQTANTVFAGPTTGAAATPTFRSLVAADIPSLSATYVLQSSVGAANGVASLDSGGKVPVAQLPSTVMIYKGAWDASTNTPTLADGTGTNGWVYRASVAGTQDLGSGSQTWAVGDFAIYNGSIWQHSPAADGVSSVNGATGAVTVNAINQLTGDATAGPASGSQSQVLTLATVNSNVGSFGSSTAIPNFTVNAKGLITAAGTNVVVAPAGTLTGTTLASNVVTSSLTTVGTIGTGTWQGTTIAVGFGGTGLSTTPTDGQLLIGSTSGNNYVKSTLTAGNGITVTNGSGSVTIAQSNFNTGDISPTSFSGANNQSAAANVTGLAFANGSVRAFDAMVSVFVNATSSLYEDFRIHAIQRGADWQMDYESVGDASGVAFTITTAGQVQYTSTNNAGFTALTMKFRAWTLPV